jgi:hypothetical protein
MTPQTNHWSVFALMVWLGAFSVGCQQSGTTAGTGAAKAQISQHLHAKTGQKQFTPEFDFALHHQVATLRSNALTLEQRTIQLRAEIRAAEAETRSERRAELAGELDLAERQWELARVAAARKQEELSRQEDSYIRAMRDAVSAARSYEAIYRIVGQQLATADRLLGETEPARRRMGLKMAREACGHVMSGAVDGWLAARICEAYFWPNLDIVDRDDRLDLLERSRRVFFDTDETNSVLKNYSLLMSNAPNARSADQFRVQLADWLEEKGNVKFAADVLNEIRDAEVLASAHERITRVRDAVAARP